MTRLWPVRTTTRPAEARVARAVTPAFLADSS
jgi:hypothetical protein